MVTIYVQQIKRLFLVYSLEKFREATLHARDVLNRKLKIAFQRFHIRWLFAKMPTLKERQREQFDIIYIENIYRKAIQRNRRKFVRRRCTQNYFTHNSDNQPQINSKTKKNTWHFVRRIVFNTCVKICGYGVKSFLS